MKFKIITALFVCMLTVVMTNAQVSLQTATLNSAGGGGTGTNPGIGPYSIDWSVGEMSLVNTTFNGNLIITQGLLQPGRDFKTSIDLSDIKISLYPNPTMNVSFIDLTITNQVGQMEGRIYNMVGQLVLPQSFNVTSSGRYRMDFSTLPAGMYMLTIKYTTQYSTDVRTQTYKVIKLN